MTPAPPPTPHPADPVGGRASLPLTPVGEATPVRADAERNRARLLEAAARLAAEHGAGNLTMEAVACAAQVGKGTVFRRFGDRTGLLLALLDHVEQQLQAAFLSGPPPLGPGAGPVERLRAFGPAVIRHESLHRDLYVASEPDALRRYTIPPYRVRHTHLSVLLRQTDAGGDTALLAQTLLGYLDTAVVQHLLTQRGMPVERLEAGWYDLVERLVRPLAAPGVRLRSEQGVRRAEPFIQDDDQVGDPPGAASSG
ncbi:TetR/AcrR family transcriptional regulator [Streptomyces sp. NPDC047928]|uniref:TetR/AcrR family transcriptional regulator n=1 Tax=unclassified Streptomyces TaxID=2593676 RepID=UPI0037207C24